MLLATLLSRALARRTNVTPSAPRPGADWLRHVASISPDELLAEIGTRASGLTEEEVAQMRAFWGENSLGGTERPSLPRRVLAAFLDPFTGILVFIAVVSVLTDWVFARPGARDLTTPAIIAVMVLVSGVLRFVQDERSSDAASALAEMVVSDAEVARRRGRFGFSLRQRQLGLWLRHWLRLRRRDAYGADFHIKRQMIGLGVVVRDGFLTQLRHLGFVRMRKSVQLLPVQCAASRGDLLP